MHHGSLYPPHDHSPETVNESKTRLNDVDLKDIIDVLGRLDSMRGNFTGTLYINGRSVKIDYDEEASQHVVVV